MLLFSSLILASLLPIGARQHTDSTYADSTYADSIRGRLITTVTTRGTFEKFDNVHPDRFYLRDASDQMLMDLIMTAPETDLFLADHAKDDLKVTYQDREVPKAGGGTERVYYLTMLRSLRTGDDVKNWPEKLAKDSDRSDRCQKELRDLKTVE